MSNSSSARERALGSLLVLVGRLDLEDRVSTDQVEAVIAYLSNWAPLMNDEVCRGLCGG